MESLKTNIIKPALALLILSAGFVGCKKDNTASPSAASPQISLGVTADNAKASAQQSLNSSSTVTTPSVNVVWTAGIANIAKFELETTKAGIKREIEARGLSNVDLFAISPALINTVIDSGTYSQIEVKVELVQSLTAAIPLKLSGTFTAPDGTIIPVEVDVNQTAELRAEAHNVVVTKTTDLKTLFILHLQQLLQGVTNADFAAATQTGGTIIISATSNIVIFNKIKVNLQGVGETRIEGHHEGGDDNNHDGGDDNGHGGSGHDGGNENDG